MVSLRKLPAGRVEIDGVSHLDCLTGNYLGVDFSVSQDGGDTDVAGISPRSAELFAEYQDAKTALAEWQGGEGVAFAASSVVLLHDILEVMRRSSPTLIAVRAPYMGRALAANDISASVSSLSEALAVAPDNSVVLADVDDITPSLIFPKHSPREGVFVLVDETNGVGVRGAKGEGVGRSLRELGWKAVSLTSFSKAAGLGVASVCGPLCPGLDSYFRWGGVQYRSAPPLSELMRLAHVLKRAPELAQSALSERLVAISALTGVKMLGAKFFSTRLGADDRRLLRAFEDHQILTVATLRANAAAPEEVRGLVKANWSTSDFAIFLKALEAAL